MTGMWDKVDMVVSLNWGPQHRTPKYSNPYYRELQNGTPNLGKSRIEFGQLGFGERQATDGECLSTLAAEGVGRR